MKKRKKKKIILTTILILFIVFLGYCIYTLNRPGIHFIGNFGRFDIDEEHTMKVYKAGEEIETRTVNVKIDGRVNGFTKRFKGIIEVEGVGTEELPYKDENESNNVMLDHTFSEYHIHYNNDYEWDKDEQGVIIPTLPRYVYNLYGNKYNKGFMLWVSDGEEHIEYIIGEEEYDIIHFLEVVE